jgi:hypothetical protein
MMKNLLKKIFLFLFEGKTGFPIFYKVTNHLFAIPNFFFHKRLAKLYKKSFLQGLANNQIIPYFNNRIWPYWLNKQQDPNCSSYSSQGLPLGIINSTNRAWTVLSHPEHHLKSCVDSRGLITAAPNSWSLDTWLMFGGKLYSPSELNETNQEIIDNSSIINTEYTIKPFTISSEVFLKPQNNICLTYNKITIQNNSNEISKLSLFFAIRPYNQEGLSPIKEIVYLTSEAFIIDGNLGLVLDKKPDNIVCLEFKDGDISENYNNWEMILKTKCKDNLASAFAEYRFTLKANESKSITIKILPTTPSNLLNIFQKTLSKANRNILNSKIKQIKALEYSKQKTKLLAYWKQKLNSLVNISIPDKEIETCLTHNFIHLLSFFSNTKKDLFSGSFFYKSFSISQIVFLIYTLNRIGEFKLAKDCLSFLLEKRKAIKLYPLKNEPDILGQIIFITGDYFLFTKDLEFINKHYKFLKSLITSIFHRQVRNSADNHKYIGLKTKSYSCDNLGISDYYLWDNFWSLAGLKSGKQIAKALNKQTLLEELSKNEQVLFENIEGFLSYTSAKTKKPSFLPISSNKLLDPRIINNLVSVYPIGILNPQSTIVSNTVSIIEKRYLEKDIFFNNLEYNGFNITQNFLLAQTYLGRQNTKLFTILKWLLENNSPTNCWPESIHPKSGSGSAGDGHHILASAHYILLIRSMLVKEEGNSLHITPIFPEEWLKNKNNTISIKNLPSHFGKLTFSYTFNKNEVTFEMSNKYKNEPTTIKLSLPKLIKQLEIPGETTQNVNKSFIHIPASISKIKIILSKE